ncbi:small ribosomal subunit protein uS9m [Magnolia sinica]|uniref:small ribosomal subunit protein uS9m n=1 Tax=Magnolia sinica TaxID=86752 RepID=UPI002659D213|nr:small ribosomal subunit protein uS9m [Magnolia sinica]XP_058069353.1 small ribosomal subunit protein uS9m [Magnolia sinica]XP_058069354.1 small ribosomal subunit protein uS9m [Magnolia sinica]
MLSRFISRPSNLRLLTLTTLSSSNIISHHPSSSNIHCPFPYLTSLSYPSRSFSTDDRNNNNNGNGRDPSSIPQHWTFSPEESSESVFGSEDASLSGIADEDDAISTVGSQDDDEGVVKEEKGGGDIFEEIDREFGSKKGSVEEWETAEGYEPWSLGEEGKEEIFESGGGGIEGLSAVDGVGPEIIGPEINEEDKQLEEEERGLSATLQGPNRAFGDLISASGITEAMLDSLIALKDLEGVEGLPPLREIEDMRLEKNERKSPRYEMERKKREEIAKSHIRQVDEKGRAYGTGRRKCSIARVWIQPGEGTFIVNDKQFDVYFPSLDHRADLLRPFAETKTLGLWDVSCTVKGGGISGQAGAVRLGVSRALQNWEPGLRPPLRSAGFLTRDSRVVERKKPGKAKARKSFQWVKR